MKDLTDIIAEVKQICEDNPVMDDRLSALRQAGYQDIEYRYVKGGNVVISSSDKGLLTTRHFPRKKIYRIQIGDMELHRGYPAAWCVDVPSITVVYEPEPKSEPPLNKKHHMYKHKEKKVSNTSYYLDSWKKGINIDDENIETSDTRNLFELCNALFKTVKAFYHNDQSYYKMDMITRYKTVIKTVWFEFERNKNEFQKSIEKRYSREISDKEMHEETEVICSWVCVQVITKLTPKSNNRYSEIF